MLTGDQGYLRRDLFNCFLFLIFPSLNKEILLTPIILINMTGIAGDKAGKRQRLIKTKISLFKSGKSGFS